MTTKLTPDEACQGLPGSLGATNGPTEDLPKIDPNFISFFIEFWLQNGVQNDRKTSNNQQTTASEPNSDFKYVFLQILAQQIDPEPWKSLNSIRKT
jgi:hypothetical protein